MSPRPLDLGDLRRTVPVSRAFGGDRGRPVDRHYIERFLADRAADIAGRVLEIGDAHYTATFGGAAVTTSDVLDIDPANPRATILADLAQGTGVPVAAFDCIVCTQTLHMIYDLRAALATLRRALAPGGVLLATLPGISQIDAGSGRETWFWSVTPHCARRLFAEAFAQGATVSAYGNVLAATAFLQGMAQEELTPDELAAHDPLYPLVVAVRAQAPR